jgi:hypothetical protein
VKHFDDDRSKHGLKPSSLDTEPVSGAATNRQNVGRRNDERQHVRNAMALIGVPQIAPAGLSVLIPGKRLKAIRSR